MVVSGHLNLAKLSQMALIPNSFICNARYYSSGKMLLRKLYGSGKALNIPFYIQRRKLHACK
jgi:hypothetical protein